MKLVNPQDVTSLSLISSNVTNERPGWLPAPYGQGDQVAFGEYIYEALTSTSDQPEVGAAKASPTWVALGRSNRWRMFRDGTDSKSSQTAQIDVRIQVASIINSVAVLGVTGSSVRVTLSTVSHGIVYDQTRFISGIGAESSDLFFADLPAHVWAELSIVISAPSSGANAECGRLIMGIETEIGVTLEGMQSRIEDFSRKERDAFGNLTLVPRRTIRIVDYEFQVEHPLVNSVQRQIMELSAVPTLFVGDDNLPETIVFGVFVHFSTIINGHTATECSLQVEEF